MKFSKYVFQFKQKTLKIVIPIRSKMLKILRRTDLETIYFEGGLGSQILAYIDFLSSPRKVDLSYFRTPPDHSANGPDIWGWELSRYGIELNDFSEFEKSKPFNPWITRRPSSLEFSNSLTNSEKKSLVPNDVKSILPVDLNNLRISLAKFDINLERTVTVHVRRGDYERVASRLVEIGEYTDLLEVILKDNTFDILFLSDTEIPQKIKKDLSERFQQNKLKFFSDTDITTHQAHDLMRMSRILITANSTFSISAGLLSEENTTVYSPILFFGGKYGYRQSRSFNRYGEFFVMRKNS
jgi:hypothetical protein